MKENNYGFWKTTLLRVIAAICVMMLVLALVAPIFANAVPVDSDPDEKAFTAFENEKFGSPDEPEKMELITPDNVEFDETLKNESYPDPDTNMGQIYAYITQEMGLNRAVAFGILAHMRRESRFLPTAYNPAGYYGICQWGGGRYSNLINWCTENGYDYSTIDGQVRFLDKELNGAYSGVLDALKECENSADGAYQAAYVFGMRYEVSGLSNAQSAGSAAMAMFNYEP